MRRIFLNSLLGKLYSHAYQNRIGNKKKNIRIKDEILFINNKLNNEKVVLNGPFKGMRYLDESSGSALLPKIMGSYELPIQNWILEIPKKKYSYIIDLGSAEGYYTTGLSIISKTNIIGVEVNKNAIELNKKLLSLNKDKLKGQVQFINKQLKSRDLNDILSHKNCLLICDIEGDELELLDPNAVPNLLKTDIIFEAHDVFRFGILYTMIERFMLSHKIEIQPDYPRSASQFLQLNNLTNSEKKLVLDERRPMGMSWVRLTAFKEEIIIPDNWQKN